MLYYTHSRRHRASISRNPLKKKNAQGSCRAAAHAEPFHSPADGSPPPAFQQPPLSDPNPRALARSADEGVAKSALPEQARRHRRGRRAGSRRHVQRCQASCRGRAVPCTNALMLGLLLYVCMRSCPRFFPSHAGRDGCGATNVARPGGNGARAREKMRSFDHRKGPRTCSEQLGRASSPATISRWAHVKGKE